MNTIYFDCSMGAAGDMLTAALLELTGSIPEYTDKLNNIGIPGVVYDVHPAVKCEITGTGVDVRINGLVEGEHPHDHQDDCEHTHEHQHDHEHAHDHGHSGVHEGMHHHSSLNDIEKITAALNIPEKVKADVCSVYRLIAEAESTVHGEPVEEIHFHEVGTMDAIADVAAVCLLMDILKPDRVITSPVHLGSGTVRCAHGVLPVPAPATALILKDVPVYSGSIKGELCTPTGAALLKYFSDEFREMPVMKIERIGYGMGHKDFEQANCVRAFLCEADGQSDIICELSCNVDDMTAEEISFAADRLFDGGAREVFTTAVGMKKSRPGVLITVLCDEEIKSRIAGLLMKYTSTLGVREKICRRYVLQRQEKTLKTALGDVRVKESEGYGVSKKKYEYDDISRIAGENDMTLDEVRSFIDNE